MTEMGSWVRVLPILVLPIAGLACGQPEDGATTLAIGAQAQELAPAATPITVTGRIVEFDLPQPAVFPQQLVVGPDGALWFRTSTAQLGRMSPIGHRVTFFPIPAIGVSGGIAVGPDRHIWFGTAAGIGRLDPISGAVDEFPLFDVVSGAQDVVAGHDGNLWTVGFDDVSRVTTAGVVTPYALPTPITVSGSHLTAGPDGNVWVENPTGALLARVTPAGAITEFPVGPGGQLFGIAAGHDHHIWFTRQGGAPGQNSIGRMTLSGVPSTVVQLPDSTTTPPNPPSGMPMAITAGDDLAMYYTTYFEQPLNYIGRVTPGGRLTKFIIPTAGAASFGITSDRTGDIWFSENFNNSIGLLRDGR
jgi:virginiamycin B lyase